MQTNIAAELLAEFRGFEGARPLVEIEGSSNARVCNFLNQLVRRMAPCERYLEIGSFKGKSLLSAAYDNRGRLCIGCDRFRFWSRNTGPGLVARQELYRNLARYRAHSAKIEFFSMSSERLFSGHYVHGPIGVYFYDGDASYTSTRHGVVSVAPHLAPRSVVVMDAWNDTVIRRATWDGIGQGKLDVLWHESLPQGPPSEGFGNGLGVFYLERAA